MPGALEPELNDLPDSGENEIAEPLATGDFDESAPCEFLIRLWKFWCSVALYSELARKAFWNTKPRVSLVFTARVVAHVISANLWCSSAFKLKHRKTLQELPRGFSRKFLARSGLQTCLKSGAGEVPQQELEVRRKSWPHQQPMSRVYMSANFLE